MQPVKINSPLTRLLAKRRSPQRHRRMSYATTPVSNTVSSPSTKQYSEGATLVNMLQDSFVVRSTTLRSDLMNELRNELGVMSTSPLRNNSVRNTTSTDHEYPTTTILPNPNQYNNNHNNHSHSNINTDANIPTTNNTYPNLTTEQTEQHLLHHIHTLELERDQSHIQVELETKRADESERQMNHLSSSVTTLQDTIAHMRVTALNMDAEKTEATLLKHDRSVKLVRQESDATLLQLQQKMSKNQNQHTQDINNKTDHIKTLKNKITGLKQLKTDRQEELKQVQSNLNTTTNKLKQCAATIKSTEQQRVKQDQNVIELNQQLQKLQEYVLMLEKNEKRNLEKEAAGILLASIDQQVFEQNRSLESSQSISSVVGK